MSPTELTRALSRLDLDDDIREALHLVAAFAVPAEVLLELSNPEATP